MRNLCHINEKSFVVFVYPKANKNIHSQALSAQENILTEKGNNQFKILTLETTMDAILDHVKTAKLKEHYKEFKSKYLRHIAT